jgi:hypothetical protein
MECIFIGIDGHVGLTAIYPSIEVILGTVHVNYQSVNKSK